MHVILLGSGSSMEYMARHFISGSFEVVLVAPEQQREALEEALQIPVLTGHPLDLQTLERAGVREAAALIAMDEKENMNIMCCEIATSIFGLKRAVALIEDPAHKPFLKRRGIMPLCLTDLLIEGILDLLSAEDGEAEPEPELSRQQPQIGRIQVERREGRA